MAKFLQRALKGIAAFTLGGPGGIMALGTRKAIIRRKAKKEEKKMIDRIRARDAIDGTNKAYLQELNKTKAQIRALYDKKKAAKKYIDQGATATAGMQKAGLNEYEVNQPFENLY